MKKTYWYLSLLGSALLLLAASLKWLPLSVVEVLGFITGAYCVWLAVLQNALSWPIGILNAGFFFFLFSGSGLFADAGLQIVYIVLGFAGWYMWLFGGRNKTPLKVRSISKAEAGLLFASWLVITYFFSRFLASVNDAAPLLDAATTTSSLIAQYMLTRKYLQNWYVWIVTDIVYIYLYISRELILTAILYAAFLTMCIVAARSWRRDMEPAEAKLVTLQKAEA